MSHDERDVETVSARVHEAWMEAKRAQGVTSRPSEWGEEQMVPYADLSERAKDLDRSSVRAVLDALDLPGRERRAKAEALTQAADLLSMLPPRIGAYVPTMADAIDGLRLRAAWYDPEEGDHE